MTPNRRILPALIILALAVLGPWVAVGCSNDPVYLASATDAARFDRGINVRSRTAGSTPALQVDARGTAAPLSIKLNGTEVASIGRSGDLAVSTGSVGAGEIADVVRQVNVPLGSFVDCQTDAGTAIGFGESVDTLADFINSATDGTGFTLRFDDTGSSEDQSSEVCSQLLVPADYSSGGSFVIRALKDASTGATEILNCAVSVNGAALEAAGTVTVSAAATAAYTCSPTIAALAAGDSLSFYLSVTSSGTMNDLVDVAAVAFRYTATQ
jgi:hypothetical protein